MSIRQLSSFVKTKRWVDRSREVTFVARGGDFHIQSTGAFVGNFGNKINESLTARNVWYKSRIQECRCILDGIPCTLQYIVFDIVATVHDMPYTGYYTVAQRNEFYFPEENPFFTKEQLDKTFSRKQLLSINSSYFFYYTDKLNVWTNRRKKAENDVINPSLVRICKVCHLRPDVASSEFYDCCISQ